MRMFFAVVIIGLAVIGVNEQSIIIGQWNGMLEVQGMQLRIVFTISEADGVLISTMDSPDQGARGIPVTSTTWVDPTLKLKITQAGIDYSGELKGNTISGTFTQHGMEFPLVLSKEPVKARELKRPQEPTTPFPYHSEEVTFHNQKADIMLAGTLTLPAKEGKFPAVILITGSGPQNRDEEVFGHKPFLVISDHLARHGIAVLRFDDRGIGASKGSFEAATTLDFATDVESALDYLKARKEIDPKKIGLAGHSEGGIIAPIVASSRADDVRFIVLMAGAGLRGDKILLIQQELIARAAGISEAEIRRNRELNEKAFEIVHLSKDSETLKAEMTRYLKETLKDKESEIPQGMDEDTFISLQLELISNPWMSNFIRFDPGTVLEKVTCPVLAVNGEKDLQVSPKENLEAIKAALTRGGNERVKIREYAHLNHLFQECQTGHFKEYGEIEQTFSPQVLADITTWIKEQIQ